MKLTSPFTIIRDALEHKVPHSTSCFIDETEVAMKESGVEMEDQLGVQNMVVKNEESTNSNENPYRG